jgi:PEP-CTERM/exosortase A-associated glycosyltransferase
MRILHVLDHSIPIHSGYSFRTRAILEHQRALGWRTEHVTSTKHTGAASAVETVNGFTFYRTLPRGRLVDRLPVLGQATVVTTLERRLAELVPAIKPDLLHAHSPCLTGLAALRVARRFGLPVVYEVRALWEEGTVVSGRSRRGGLRYRASRALETHVLRRCDAVTTICEGLRRELVSRGINGEKVTVIPNGVDIGRFSFNPPVDAALARQLRLEGKSVLAFAGSFYEYEGLSLLMRALPAILERRPTVRLLLVGGGEQEQALRREAHDRGLDSLVVFAGPVPHDDVDAYYSLSDICVYPRLPSRAMEIVTPLKPLEAMAQGKVVVASDVGGHKELIDDGRTGVLFRAGDAASLADTVLRTLGNTERMHELRQTARRYVERERTWPRLVAGYEAVYANALSSPSHTGIGFRPQHLR